MSPDAQCHGTNADAKQAEHREAVQGTIERAIGHQTGAVRFGHEHVVDLELAAARTEQSKGIPVVEVCYLAAVEQDRLNAGAAAGEQLGLAICIEHKTTTLDHISILGR